jgi:hemoglobin
MHSKVNKNHHHTISQEHFGVWLNIWYQTIDELFEGDYVENEKFRARKMSSFYI